jgi:DNA-binding beta-propeller fold protein YncE/predicted GH43/DUF377 family glycosyl hydrolase
VTRSPASSFIGGLLPSRQPSAAARRPAAAVLGLALGALGCKQDLPLPYVGPCAEYPEGIYDFGEIGIGTCLSGSTEVHFTDDADGNPVLVVTNANTYQNFTGGSLLTIPWSGINLDIPRNLVSEIGAAAVDLPDFAGGLAITGDLALVTVRLSEGSRVRQHWDDVWLVDLSEPLAPRLAPRGTNASARVRVQSDPNDVEIDPTSGYAFVSNRTSHSISILATDQDLVSVVRPWPEAVLSTAQWFDADGSGSRAALDDLAVIDSSLVTDDNWSMDWISGTWRVWVEAEGGVRRYNNYGSAEWRTSEVGLEMEFENLLGEDGRVTDPTFTALGNMYYSSSGAIRTARSLGDTAGLWQYSPIETLGPRDAGWDSLQVGGPGALLEDDGLNLFYDGISDDLTAVSAIGYAWSPDGLAFEREDLPVLEASEDWEAGGLFDPAPVLDPETGQIVLHYSAFDGVRWRVGRASTWDRYTWEKELLPVFEVDGVDIAAPDVSPSVGLWRMTYARRVDGGDWELWEAESPDGRLWTEKGLVAIIDESIATLDTPPGAALTGLAENRFRMYGEQAGNLSLPIVPGIPFYTSAYGYGGRPVSGYLAGTGDAGAESEGGIRVSSISTDAGLAWLSLNSAGGIPRVGLADLDEDFNLDIRDGAIFEGTSGFDRDGADMPVVLEVDGTWHMYYRGHRGRSTSIGHATSTDGVTWSRQGRVLRPGRDWDNQRIEPGSVEVLPNGDLRLWYSGTNGDYWQVGSAISSDGTSFVREGGGTNNNILSPGIPGEWDDSGVRHPFAIRGTDAEDRPGTHVWYAGSDGATWRGGYAFRPDRTLAFERAEDFLTGIPRPVVLAGGGQFSPEGALRPVLAETARGWQGFYAGRAGTTDRVGGLAGEFPNALHRVLHMPTVGDRMEFNTERGDPDALAIPLDIILPPGIALTGTGLTSIATDPERGYLYAASKLTAYIYIIDIRDDSVGDFRDLNYLDVEAILPAPNSSMDAGFRQILADPRADRLLALQDDPEAVVVFDLTAVEDNAFAELISDTAVGYLPVRRGSARDEGVFTLTDIGPSNMVLHPDQRRLFVANFNGNSVSLFDLELGTWGQQIGEVSLVGEGPAGMTLTPDAKHLVVANLAGEVTTDGLAQSTIAVIDVEESSPTYLEVRTWITNN